MKELLDYYDLPADTEEFKIYAPTLKQCNLTEKFLRHYGFRPLSGLTALKRDYVLYSVIEVYVFCKKFCYSLPDYNVDDLKKPPSLATMLYLEHMQKKLFFKRVFFNI